MNDAPETPKPKRWYMRFCAWLNDLVGKNSVWG